MALDFPNWLQAELDHRDWNQAALARRAGVSRAAISDVMAGKHPAGLDLCTGIARALKMAPETVMREAGLLPAGPVFTHSFAGRLRGHGVRPTS